MAEMSVSSRTAWALVRAMARTDQRAGPSTGVATVRSVDSDGTVWVRLPGSTIDTPVNGTVTASVAAGQSVSYRLSGGRLSVTGNATSPSVGQMAVEARVAPVEQTATEALSEAQRASNAADMAELDAQRASVAAGEAQESAEAAQASADEAGAAAQQAISDASDAGAAAAAAQTSADAAQASASQAISDAAQAQSSATSAQNSATQANAAANDALTQLSTVQDVVGTVEWAAAHSEQDMATYISSHLALTDAGLWVLKDAQGYRLLAANDGVRVVDAQGHTVTTLGESIIFDSSRPQYIGGEGAYIVFFDASGDDVPDTIRIGGNVLMGGDQTLSEVLAIVDEPTYDHSYALVGGSYTFTAHLWRGGTDVAASIDPDYFGWWLRTESGETEIGRGLTVTVPASGAGYRGTVVGGVDDVLALQIADSSGNLIVDDSGDGIETYVPLEV